MMLVAARGWRRRALIVVAGGLLPVGYQIFRMGYYGLLFPGTALAKDASGSKWSQGFVYLANFNQPYLLWAPAILLVGLAVMVLVTRGQPWWNRRAVAPGYGLAGADGAKPFRRRDFHHRQRAAAGDLLDPPGRRLHARPGVADAVVLSAGAGRGDSDRVARRNTNGPRRRATCSRARPACCGWRSRVGRCGRPTRPAWDPTPPASPTPASSTSDGSTPRPPATRIR